MGDDHTKKKLDSLLSEVGALRAEVDLQRSLRELDSQTQRQQCPSPIDVSIVVLAGVHSYRMVLLSIGSDG